MRTFFLQASLGLAVASTLVPRVAAACGGCFHEPVPPQEPQLSQVVTGHRMAFSISTTQTILWDQIQYSGSPQNFAWVLPVRAGAKIELSHDEWFGALETLTAPVITAPTPPICGGGSTGPSMSCGGGNNNGNASGEGDASADGFGGSGGGVQVISQSVVGPYDTVTLQATDPNALYNWLTVNKYDVPMSIRPTIDAYVAGGFDFIALRMAPGQGVQAMQPVRVVTPGAGLTLPLRMIEAGAGAEVGVTLYVIGGGRYEARNFPNGAVDPAKLRWDPVASLSNYGQLATQIMAGGGGRTWLTESSGPIALPGAPTDYCSGGVSFAGLYFSRCMCPCPGFPVYDDAGFPEEAGGGGGDGGACTACDMYDDIDVALTGQDPNNIWVTRMRANLPSSSLSAGDLDLQASSSQAQISAQYAVQLYTDPAYNPCGPNGSGGCATAPDDRATGRWLVIGSLGLVWSVFAKRRRARSPGE